MANFVVGKIINMHGIKGEFKVFPETDSIDRFNELDYVLLRGEKYEIESARPHKGCCLLKLKGIDSINDGERFKNELLEIYEEDAEELGEDEYFIRDIFDCKVVDDKTDEVLGIVTDVMSTKANDVFEVTMSNKKTFLVPNIKDIVLSVDITNKTIRINVMEGLI